MTTTLDLIRRSEGKPAVAVLNAVLPRGTKHEQAADIIQGLQLPVCPASLGQRVAFDHASTVGQTAKEYDPHGKAATEITHILFIPERERPMVKKVDLHKAMESTAEGNARHLKTHTTAQIAAASE